MGLKLHEKQRLGWKILTDPAKTRILFDGGSRSGKTALLIEYSSSARSSFPLKTVMARKCRAHAKTSIWNDTVKQYLARFIPRRFYKLQETELSVVFWNGSQIVIGGLDDAERTEKILGNEYITVFLNEATQLSWETAQMAMTRLAQRCADAKGRFAVPKLILDCNPRGPRHWLHYVGVRQLDPESEKPLHDAANWARLNWSAYDNKAHLPPAYLEALEALPELMRDRMLNGVWRSNEGSVYSEFDEDVHVLDDFAIPPHWRRLRAIDFGYTNPFVCLWGALDEDGRLYVYREHYKASTRTAEHAGIIKRLSGEERYFVTVADHDAAERAELENCGSARSRRKGGALRHPGGEGALVAAGRRASAAFLPAERAEAAFGDLRLPLGGTQGGRQRQGGAAEVERPRDGRPALHGRGGGQSPLKELKSASSGRPATAAGADG
jgi:phage terminase large subunit